MKTTKQINQQKRAYTLILAMIFSLPFLYAQGEIDAYKLSGNNLTGTARSVSMGGAFGSYIGGDVSAIGTNPAAITEYWNSEVVTTLSFQNTRTTSTINNNKSTDSRFKIKLDNLAFVYHLPLKKTIIPFINLGFSYNKIKDFDHQYSMGGNTRNSLTDYMAIKADGWQTTDLSLNSNPQAWHNTDWLPVLGYNSSLITNSGNSPDRYISTTQQYRDTEGKLIPYTTLYNQERGSINSYDFNVGTIFLDDRISFGLTVSMTDINYRMYSIYSEDFQKGIGEGSYNLRNTMKTDGTGWQFKTGLVYKPVDQFSIGISYHSPTWYSMTDSYAASIDHNLSGLQNSNIHVPADYIAGNVQSFEGLEDATVDYRLRTPDKWVFTLVGVLFDRLTLSGNYELTNYSKMRLHDSDGNSIADDYMNPNTFINEDFRNSSTVRFGSEVLITYRLLGRIGFAWVQSPLTREFKNNEKEVATVGSIPHYTLDGNTSYFTYGLGYRFKNNIYTDIAFVMSSQKSDLYSFPKVIVDGKALVIPDKVSLKTNRFQGLLTVGYRF